MNKEELFRLAEGMIHNIAYVDSEEIPNIPLYMDQVTTFMDEQLGSGKRYPEDKILTKTMINNYAKNHLLPAPEKKKYSREHMLALIFIYYFKNFLLIKDIESLLNPLMEEHFDSKESLNLKNIYDKVVLMEKGRSESIEKSIQDAYVIAEEYFASIDAKDKEFLIKFAFICNLTFDVYVKKQLIEKLIDELPSPDTKKKK